jgi:hypothetical protein
MKLTKKSESKPDSLFFETKMKLQQRPNITSKKFNGYS